MDHLANLEGSLKLPLPKVLVVLLARHFRLMSKLSIASSILNSQDGMNNQVLVLAAILDLQRVLRDLKFLQLRVLLMYKINPEGFSVRQESFLRQCFLLPQV